MAGILDKTIRYHFSDRYPSAVEALAAIASLTNRNTWWKNYQRSLLIGGIVLIASGGFIAALNQPLPPPEMAEYSAEGIAIKYPEDWDRESDDELGAYTVTLKSPLESNTDNFQEQAIVNIVDLPNPLLLNEYTDNLVKGIKNNLSNFQLLESCERGIILSNGKTNRVCYTGTEDGRNLKYLLVATLRGDRAYYIIYRAEPDKYDKFLKAVKEMIISFKILEERSGV